MNSASHRRAEIARLYLLRAHLTKAEYQPFKARILALLYGAPMWPMLPAPEKSS